MNSDLASPSDARKLGRVALVLHDAGAGLQGLGWLPYLGADAILVAQGPSRGLAISRGLSPTADVAAAIDEADWVLTGSGWMSTFECDALAMARSQRKPVFAILDNWVNYRERFGDRIDEVIPDGFVVSDEFARTIAQKTFPETLVVEWPNQVLRDMRRTVNHGESMLNDDHERHLLLLGEPLRRNLSNCEGEPEEYLIKWTSEAVINADGRQIMPVRLRLHPTEDAGKYDEVISKTRIMIDVVEERHSPVDRDLIGAAAVVGFTSYALFLASKCGLVTYSLAGHVCLVGTTPPGCCE